MPNIYSILFDYFIKIIPSFTIAVISYSYGNYVGKNNQKQKQIEEEKQLHQLTLQQYSKMAQTMANTPQTNEEAAAILRDSTIKIGKK